MNKIIKTDLSHLVPYCLVQSVNLTASMSLYLSSQSVKLKCGMSHMLGHDKILVVRLSYPKENSLQVNCGLLIITK